ncbi:MAG TPA: hypothetical protein VHM70_16425 [Polyangiaceae bacterium]|nr:hypothetical protein [Polyangiaceae bacterium]
MPAPTERTRRLEWRHGQWSLQISELVQVERDSYLPRQRRIEGVEAIRSHLARHGEDSLARGLNAVVSDPNHRGIGFDAVDGKWVPDRSATMPSLPVQGPDVTARVSALNAEITLLKATVWGLTERLAAVERRVAHAVPASTRTSSATLAAFVDDRDPAKSLLAATSSPVAFREAPVVPTPEPAQQVTRDAPADDETEAADALPLDDSGFAPLDLPLVSDMLQCLKVLLGADPGAKSTKQGLPATQEGIGALYGSCLLDDESQERGALITDLRAAYDLGGALMGWTPQAIAQKLETGTLDTEVGEGMSEVMNNLSGVINRVSSTHTRSSPLQALAERPMTWLSARCRARGFVTKSQGHVWVVSR